MPDVSKIEILGAQDERIFVEFSMQELASLGIDRSALLAALQAQNVVLPAGTIQTGNETLSLRVSGSISCFTTAIATAPLYERLRGLTLIGRD